LPQRWIFPKAAPCWLCQRRGLLRDASKYFQLPKGFYGLKTIFLLLAFMALARLKSIEASRYPGTDLRLIYELVSAQTP
jgi:hypothetical protein